MECLVREIMILKNGREKTIFKKATKKEMRNLYGKFLLLF